MLDLSQRGTVELVVKQLTGSGIAKIFTHWSDEGVLAEEGTGEFLIDLLVGVEKSSGVDERLISLDIPKGSARADHQTFLEFIQTVSDDDGVACIVHEALMFGLLLRRVARDDNVFVDLFECQ